MVTRLLSRTSLGLPLIAHDFGAENFHSPRALIIGGVHGDEIEGVACARGLLAAFLQSFQYQLRLTLIPEMNPEGVLHKTRGNANGVDLNRNLPTQDWSPHAKTPRYQPGPHPLSEIENQTLVAELKDRPSLIISLHSWEPVLNVNGDCRPEAEVLSKHTGYRIDPDIGYPTPGSLGTYAGIENQIPTLTYEIQRGLTLDQVLKIHVPALLAALSTTEKRFKK
jgi:protein MpaA